MLPYIKNPESIRIVAKSELIIYRIDLCRKCDGVVSKTKHMFIHCVPLYPTPRFRSRIPSNFVSAAADRTTSELILLLKTINNCYIPTVGF